MVEITAAAIEQYPTRNPIKKLSQHLRNKKIGKVSKGVDYLNVLLEAKLLTHGFPHQVFLTNYAISGLRAYLQNIKDNPRTWRGNELIIKRLIKIGKKQEAPSQYLSEIIEQYIPRSYFCRSQQEGMLRERLI